MKDEYIVFFDESMHTPKLNTNEKWKINVFAKDEALEYVGTFCAFKQDNWTEIEGLFIDLENKTKRCIGIKPEDEFKSTTMKKNQFKRGIQTFDSKYIKFYTQFIELLINNSTFI